MGRKQCELDRMRKDDDPERPFYLPPLTNKTTLI